MRRTFIFIAFVIGSVLLFNACKDDNNTDDGLSLSSNFIEALAEGGNFKIGIKTGAAWTATFDDTIDWATVTPASGSGKDSVTVIILPNVSEYPRVVRLDIVSKGIKKQVRINQSTGSGGVSAITSSRTIEAAATGAPYEFSLTGQRGWSVSASENWIKFEKKRGTGKGYISYTGTSVAGESDSTLTVFVNPNLSDMPRSAFIILKSDYSADTITVTQPAIDFDYYKDGELVTLHTNPDNPHHGAPLVIVGDGWGVEDLKKGGLWEKWVNSVKDLLFQVEMAKDFPDKIDVYAVAALSNQRGIYGNNRFGTVAGVPPAPLDAIKSMGRKVLTATGHPNAQYVTFIASSNGAIGGWNYGDLCTLSTPDGEPSYVYWMLHEYFGHTFSNLSDLYFNCAFTLDWPNLTNLSDAKNTPAGSPSWNWESIDDKTFPQCYKGGDCNTVDLYKEFKRDWDKGYSWMVDFTVDPAKVIWKDFIGKPGYNNVGVYPTAWNGFCGLTGPEEHTAMRDNPYFTFDVGSRYQIWKKVYVRSGSYPESDKSFLNLDNFMAFDHAAGYDDNGVRANGNFSIRSNPELFTDAYWKNNNLYPKKPGFTPQKK